MALNWDEIGHTIEVQVTRLGIRQGLIQRGAHAYPEAPADRAQRSLIDRALLACQVALGPDRDLRETQPKSRNLAQLLKHAQQ